MLARTALRRRVSREGAVVIGALALLAACSSPSGNGEPKLGGPIKSSPDIGTVCLQARPGEAHDFTLGFNIVTNTGPEPAKIGRLELVGPKDLEIEDAWLVATSAALGDHSRFPPTREALAASELDWDQRVAIPGASAESGGRYNLVLHVAATSRFPSASGIRFTYTASGEEHQWQTNIGFTVRDPC
ncbi:hypothetical protein ACIRN4_06745 [Pimelobacter simplex]|uniref:hypothetical protein n=1 Tax=Nocardioides simplex TaxID=2045 RepID=UPI00381FECA0